MPKIIKDGVAYGDGVMVDTALDSTSENPVQNKVVTGEINDIKSALSDLPHNFGTSVSLLTYTFSNPYEAPSDGYIICGSYSTNEHTECYVNGILFVSSPRGFSGVTTLFVRKGSKMYGVRTGQNCGAQFIPLV